MLDKPRRDTRDMKNGITIRTFNNTTGINIHSFVTNWTGFKNRRDWIHWVQQFSATMRTVISFLWNIVSYFAPTFWTIIYHFYPSLMLYFIIKSRKAIFLLKILIDQLLFPGEMKKNWSKENMKFFQSIFKYNIIPCLNFSQEI